MNVPVAVNLLPMKLPLPEKLLPLQASSCFDAIAFHLRVGGEQVESRERKLEYCAPKRLLEQQQQQQQHTIIFFCIFGAAQWRFYSEFCDVMNVGEFDGCRHEY